MWNLYTIAEKFWYDLIKSIELISKYLTHLVKLKENILLSISFLASSKKKTYEFIS